MPLFRNSFVVISALLMSITLPRIYAADAVAELGKFSVFEQLDLNKLAGGKVLTARGPTLESPRDLGVQAIYLVPVSLQKAVEQHRQWDPLRHPELKVYLHGDLSGKPGVSEFAKLGSAPDNRAVRAFAAATQKLPNKGDLQLSNAEAQDFSKFTGGDSQRGNLPPAISAFWSHILAQRAADFATRGLSSQPPYDSGNQSARVSDEVSRLLKEQPKIRAQFRGMVEQTPLGGGAGSLSPSLYWEMFDVEGEAAVSLGAAYTKEGTDSAQLVDMQYYASGGYFAFITLYQMWPITVNNKPATLVWRGDSLSSLSLSELHGVERMGSGAAMMKEVQKAINLLQQDIAQ